jgi:hypothetical protein
MRSIRPSRAYFKLCLDEDSARSSFINHHDFGKEWGLQMTLQVKGVQIAKISALTIRNASWSKRTGVRRIRGPAVQSPTAAGKTNR